MSKQVVLAVCAVSMLFGASCYDNAVPTKHAWSSASPDKRMAFIRTIAKKRVGLGWPAKKLENWLGPADDCGHSALYYIDRRSPGTAALVVDYGIDGRVIAAGGTAFPPVTTTGTPLPAETIQEAWQSGDTVRRMRVAQTLSRHLAAKLTRNEIVSLLGEPDELAGPALIYHEGPEKRHLLIFSLEGGVVKAVDHVEKS